MGVNKFKASFGCHQTLNKDLKDAEIDLKLKSPAAIEDVSIHSPAFVSSSLGTSPNLLSNKYTNVKTS